jgi:hypothetical protein
MNEEYRDPELKSLCAEWLAPEPTVDLRSRVLTAFDREFGVRNPGRRRWSGALVPETWKGMLAGFVFGAVVCCLVIGQAFPQSLSLFSGFRIPYVVEWEFFAYTSDGSPGFEAHFSGFKNGGDEIILSGTVKGLSAFQNTVRGIWDSGRTLLIQVAPSLMLPQQSSESVAWNRAYVRNGCLGHGPETGETVIGHEIILGHSTTIVLFTQAKERTTQWLAPDLGCFALKQITEELRSDGSYLVLRRVQALKVTVNK